MHRLNIGIAALGLLIAGALPAPAQPSTGAERSPGGTVQRPNIVQPDLQSGSAVPSGVAGSSSGPSTGDAGRGGTMFPVSPQTCQRGWSPALGMSNEEFVQACR